MCLSALVLSKLYKMVRTFEVQNLGADTVEVLLLYSDNLGQSSSVTPNSWLYFS